MDTQALHAALAAVCPVQGVSIGRADDRATWRVDFDPAATTQQQAAAAAVLAAFDPTVPAPTPRNAFAELDALKVSLKSAKSFADINAAAVALDVAADGAAVAVKP